MNIGEMPQAQIPEVCMGDDASVFFRDGFLEPVSLLKGGQRDLLLSHLTFGMKIDPAIWWKGRAVTDRLLYDIASCPELLDILRPLLGENIILWGAITVERNPGQVHEWHVDIESAAPDQRFASVWIGLRNTSQESGLAFVKRSHAFPTTIQEVQHAKQYRRGDATDEMVLAWAKDVDPMAELDQPDVNDGDALVFDGRIWHGSLNRSDSGARLALLLQYASTDAPVFMPDVLDFEWPFKFRKDERPPVIVVSGEGNRGANRQVPPPPTSAIDAVSIATEIRPITLPLTEDSKSGWRPHPLFAGLTNIHDSISCHVSVLSPGKIPHPPHSHIEEEILIVLDGEAELLIGDGPRIKSAKAHPVSPGMFVYYPAFQHHTLRNTGSGPLTYLMFKWRGTPMAAETMLSTCIVDPKGCKPESSNAFRTSLLFEGPTNFLSKLHVHYSEVEPDGGYKPHRDEYDVAIVVLSGNIETLGQTVDPFGVIYYAAHELHGLRGTGPEPARYIVFEFHGGQNNDGKRKKLRGAIPNEARTLFRRLEKLSRNFPRLRRLIPEPVKKLAKYLLD